MVALLVLAVLAGFTLSFLIAKNVPSTVTNTINETTTMSVGLTTTVTQVMMTTSTLQLTTQLRFPQLILQLNVTTIMSGQAISINISEYDPFLSFLNVTASTQFLQDNNFTLGPCGSFDLPFGIAVFQGYFTAMNFSSGKSLNIYSSYETECPAYQSPDYYMFLPSSYNATPFHNETTFYGPPWITMIDSIETTGFWNSGFPNSTNQSEHFQSFPSGVYTLVAGDDWQEVEVAHFTVLPNAT